MRFYWLSGYGSMVMENMAFFALICQSPYFMVIFLIGLTLVWMNGVE